MDLRIGHYRWGSSSNPVLNWKLHYLLPADIDKPLHDAAAEKIREYCADYMMLLLKKYANNVLIMIIVPLILFLLCLLLLPPLADFTRLWACANFNLAGSSGNRPTFCSFRSWDCATSPGSVPFPPRCFLLPAQILATSSSKPLPYVSTSTSMVLL